MKQSIRRAAFAWVLAWGGLTGLIWAGYALPFLTALNIIGVVGNRTSLSFWECQSVLLRATAAPLSPLSRFLLGWRCDNYACGVPLWFVAILSSLVAMLLYVGNAPRRMSLSVVSYFLASLIWLCHGSLLTIQDWYGLE